VSCRVMEDDHDALRRVNLLRVDLQDDSIENPIGGEARRRKEEVEPSVLVLVIGSVRQDFPVQSGGTRRPRQVG
jgi:hypothetical protein